MAYLVLARKYRPLAFAELVGQEAVKRTLQGALETDRVGHAYLFAGSRGTGKTTVARILAKALNCEKGPGPEPCNTCSACESADRGSYADLIEIDGASNNGVENVRTLRDQAAYAPLEGRYKIYLIDEVHMLSKPAFNALLKTLEEPPPHVKFLFATTEPHRVIDTVLSRCQVLKLTPLSEELIAKRLGEVFEAEGVQAGEGVARELARRARGGMRDALSLADQVLSRGAENLTLEDLTSLDGGGRARAAQILEMAAEGDRPGVLQALPVDEGQEGEVLGELLDHLRAAVLAGLCGPNVPHLQVHAPLPEERTALVELAKKIGGARAELWLTDLLTARERLRLLPAMGRVILEAALLEMCRDGGAADLGVLVQRLEALESRLGGAPVEEGEARALAQERAPRVQDSQTSSLSGSAAVSSGEDQGKPSTPASQSAVTSPSTGTLDNSTGSDSPVGGPASSRPASKPAAAPGASQRVRRRANSAQDAWQGFLEELRKISSSLGRVFERQGSLLKFEGSQAVIELRTLREDERGQVLDRRSGRQIEAAFEAAVGRPVQVQLQDTAATQPGSEDAFTSSVRDQFDGRIEE
ncbi:MAG: DNA polymerase III subunit gamma/tau [bacterium]